MIGEERVEQNKWRKNKTRPQERTGLKMVRRKRFELLTYRFVACCSIQLGYRRTRDKVYTSVRGGSSRNNCGLWEENRKSVGSGGERVFGDSGQAAIAASLIPGPPLGLGPAPGRAVAAATVLFLLFSKCLRADEFGCFGMFHGVSPI